MSELKHILWAERYRPENVADCILPTFVKNLATQIMETGDVPNLLLIGSSGVGKTTLAKAICKQLDLDYMVRNASMGGNESGIDALRTDISRFATTQSMFSDKRKIVILDEADHLSSNVQAAFRNFMEEHSRLCGFILTCNLPFKIIDPIHSRCTKIDFDTLIQDDSKELKMSTLRRIEKILKAEGVEYDQKVLVALIKSKFPDVRHILNLLQGYVKASGKIDEGILSVYRDTNFDEVIDFMKAGSWTKVRDWVFSQGNLKPEVYSKLYKTLEMRLQNKSKPALVIILNEHQDKATRVVDKNICLLSALTEVMSNCTFAE